MRAGGGGGGGSSSRRNVWLTARPAPYRLPVRFSAAQPKPAQNGESPTQAVAVTHSIGAKVWLSAASARARSGVQY